MKHSYSKPVVSRVELVTEQAVLTACKNSTVGVVGPNSGLYDCYNTGGQECYLSTS